MVGLLRFQSLQISSQGLSAHCLRSLCTASGCPVAGNSSMKSSATRLLDHLKYPKEQADRILETFKQRAGKKNDGDLADESERMMDDAFGDDDGEVGVDTMCEAKLLNKLLHKMEMTEAKAATDEQKSPQEPLKPAAPWNDQDRGLQDKEEVGDENVPPGCRIDLKRPPNASPYIQGFLPAGQTWRGIKSTSRAYRPRTALSTLDGRADRTFAAAKAEVLAFLWEWQDAKDGPANHEPPGPSAKRQKTKQ